MSKKIGTIISWLIFTPLVLIALGIAYCEINKAYWDHRVKEMCEKDGGVTVFEKVELTKEEYDRNDGKNGVIHVAPERTSPAHNEYAYKSSDTEIHKSNPEVWRSEYTTYRKSDGKYLGKWVTYSRRGGDFPSGIMHDSSFSCAKTSNFESNPIGKIFSVKGE